MAGMPYDDDFAKADSTPCATPPVLVSSDDEQEDAEWREIVEKGKKRLAEHAADQVVAKAEKRQRRDVKDTAAVSKKKKKKKSGPWKADYRVAEIYPDSKRALIRKQKSQEDDDDGAPSHLVTSALCSLSPFVKQTVCGTYDTEGRPVAEKVIQAVLIKPTPAVWKKFSPPGWPVPSNLKKLSPSAIPPGEAFDPLRRAHSPSYFTFLPIYGHVVCYLLQDRILGEIEKTCLSDQRFLFLALTGLPIPVHLHCADVLLECPEGNLRGQAIFQAKELYKHLLKCHENGLPVTEAGTQAGREVLIEFGLAVSEPTFRLAAPHADNELLKALGKTAKVHHCDSLYGQIRFMAKQDPKKTLFYFPSANTLDLAKSQLTATQFSAVLMADVSAADIQEDFDDPAYDLIVVMFSERVPNRWWALFPRAGRKLVCVGDRFHHMTVPFGVHYFGGFSRLWECSASKHEHPWEQTPDGRIWQGQIHQVILAGDFPRLMEPNKVFTVHRGKIDWATIKKCVRNVSGATSLDEHTAIAPKNDTLVLASPNALVKLQQAFLTRDFEEQMWKVPKAVVFSFRDLFASKISGISPHKVDLHDSKSLRQWTRDDKHASEFRLVNLTTLNQCFSGLVKHLVFVIDKTTTKLDLAVALKFTDPHQAKVDIFWAPYVPERERSLSMIE